MFANSQVFLGECLNVGFNYNEDNMELYHMWNIAVEN